MGPVTEANGKKTARAGSLVVLMLLMVLGAAAPALAAPGDVDTSFGDDGAATGPAGSNFAEIALDPDGKIVAAGWTDEDDIILSLYNQDGSPDTTFDGDGRVVSTFLQRPQVVALAVQPDGKIVVAGSKGWGYDDCHEGCVFLARYTAGGSPDTTFSGDGKSFGKILFYRGLVLQPGGGIIAAGWTDDAERLTTLSRHFGGDDVTPPGPVTDLTYTLGDHEVSYTWTNPTDSDFEEVRVLRSLFRHADGPTPNHDQTKVYEASGTSLTDAGLQYDPERYYYTVFTRDTSGNWSGGGATPETEWYAAPMRVDTLPVEFYFRSPTDPGATFQCKIDAAAFSACSSPKEYTNLPDGPHTFYVRAKSADGNVDPTPASFTWTVDTRKPVTTIESGPSGTISSGSARFTFSSDEPVAYDPRYVGILDGAAYQHCESPMTYEGLGNGRHTFEVYAADQAGNRGLAATRTWAVGPETTSENLAPDATLTSDAEDDGATAEDPMETSITSPVGGATSVTETTSTTQTEPANYSFLGQQANITTPPSTAERPLRFEFRLDSSLIPAGETESTVEVFRNGILVQNCTDGASNVAAPDPCVLGRQLLEDGDVRFTILTSAASRWKVGVFDDAPKVLSVTPTHLARNASAKTNMTATFSEAMKASTVNANSFVLAKRGTTTPIAAQVVYSDTTRKATLNPKRDLKPGATYTATIKGGANGAADATGNAFAQDKAWTFTIKKR